MKKLKIVRDNSDSNYFHFYYDNFYGFMLHTDVLYDIVGQEMHNEIKKTIADGKKAYLRIEVVL